jgi:23S rRNA U2552 (ribose-2'-O)-methylase RlmE/FtsJ
MKSKIAYYIRILPKPFNYLVINVLVRLGLLNPQNKYYLALGCPKEILAGPFVGLRYYPNSHGSMLLPKILGTYEKELTAILCEMTRESPDVVVDIGSAEGYYAVGLAKLLSEARIITFDVNSKANAKLLKNAQLNRVANRIDIRQACTFDNLKSVLKNARSPLIISDCEGYEFELLNPAKVEGLKNADMIVEIHPDKDKNTVSHFVERFNATHKIDVITSEKRTINDWPSNINPIQLSDHEKIQAMNERPSSQQWVILSKIA